VFANSDDVNCGQSLPGGRKSHFCKSSRGVPSEEAREAESEKKLDEKQIHITKIKQCKYVTAAGNVTAGVCVSLASSEPIEF